MGGKRQIFQAEAFQIIYAGTPSSRRCSVTPHFFFFSPHPTACAVHNELLPKSGLWKAEEKSDFLVEKSDKTQPRPGNQG